MILLGEQSSTALPRQTSSYILYNKVDSSEEITVDYFQLCKSMQEQ